MSCTLNIDWLLDVAMDLFASQGVNITKAELLERIDDWVDTSNKPGQILYQPYISDAGERGPFISTSARAGFVGLAMGGAPAQIRLTGGAARSKALRRVFANTLGAQLRTCSREEAGAAGAAMMASLSIGHYTNMNDCVQQWVTPLLGSIEDFDDTQHAMMDDVFATYQSTRQALTDVWKSQAQLRQP